MEKTMKAHCFVLMTVFFLQPALAQPAAPSPHASDPGSAIEKHQITDGSGRTIVYYISHPRQPAPLLLMIQGSGCAPVVMDFVRNGKPSYGTTMFDLLPFAMEGRFTVMVVEKPHASSSSGDQSGTATTCSAAFNDDFTAETWLTALQAAVRDARRDSHIESGRTLVLGESEGAVMASLLASHDESITDVAFLAGSGTTQLFDMFAMAYRHCPDASCTADIEKQVKAIQANPDSATDFAWGHPYKRWSSFLKVDAADELLRSKARVYIAFGTEDDSVPAVSGEVAAAKLMAFGHDITVRRVPNGNHMLLGPNSTNLNDLDKELRAALSWFWSK